MKMAHFPLVKGFEPFFTLPNCRRWEITGICKRVSWNSGILMIYFLPDKNGKKGVVLPLMEYVLFFRKCFVEKLLDLPGQPGKGIAPLIDEEIQIDAPGFPFFAVIAEQAPAVTAMHPFSIDHDGIPAQHAADIPAVEPAGRGDHLAGRLRLRTEGFQRFALPGCGDQDEQRPQLLQLQLQSCKHRLCKRRGSKKGIIDVNDTHANG